MATRTEFLKQVWDENINAFMAGHWIENLIKTSERQPNSPFADTGIILKKLLTLGASKEDLSFVARYAAYETSFGILYSLEDPGVDDTSMLHESLLSADPSGKEGRPGSWPVSR
jgi:hypothetical protein